MTTVNGADLTIAASGDLITVNGTPMVVCGNVQTANATVHIIDSVLVPAAADAAGEESLERGRRRGGEDALEQATGAEAQQAVQRGGGDLTEV